MLPCTVKSPDSIVSLAMYLLPLAAHDLYSHLLFMPFPPAAHVFVAHPQEEERFGQLFGRGHHRLAGGAGFTLGAAARQERNTHVVPGLQGTPLTFVAPMSLAFFLWHFSLFNQGLPSLSVAISLRAGKRIPVHTLQHSPLSFPGVCSLLCSFNPDGVSPVSSVICSCRPWQSTTRLRLLHKDLEPRLPSHHQAQEDDEIYKMRYVYDGNGVSRRTTTQGWARKPRLEENQGQSSRPLCGMYVSHSLCLRSHV